jgi:molybdopterin-guanine dinucleotide biosynthesis protein A
VLEEPRFGGPVAALAAALPGIRTPLLALLATDMPRAGALVGSLLAAFSDGDQVLMSLDADGRRQQLCSILRRDALAAALACFPTPEGVAMRALMANLDVRELPLPPELADLLHDIDTPADLRRASELP